jgi:hypothetical protein
VGGKPSGKPFDATNNLGAALDKQLEAESARRSGTEAKPEAKPNPARLSKSAGELKAVGEEDIALAELNQEQRLIHDELGEIVKRQRTAWQAAQDRGEEWSERDSDKARKSELESRDQRIREQQQALIKIRDEKRSAAATKFWNQPVNQPSSKVSSERKALPDASAVDVQSEVMPEAKPGTPKPTKTRLVTIKQQFDKLVLDYVASHDIPHAGIVFEDVKSLPGGARSTHSAEVQRLRRVVLSELGLKVDSKNNADLAAAIPLLKEKITQKENFTSAISKASDEAGKIDVEVSDLKVGDTLEVEGEPVRVAKVGPDSVELDDGRKFGRQEVRKGETIYVEGYQPKSESTGPKLSSSQKTGTGELFQGADQPFNLAGEKATDFERVSSEQAAAEKAKKEAAGLQSKQETELPMEPPKPAKWTKATDELGGELYAGIPNPAAVARSVASLARHAAGVLKPGVARAAGEVVEIGRELKSIGKVNDYRKSVLNWSAKLQRSFGEAADAQREIVAKVKNKVRRKGITNWIQADGDAATLTARRDATVDPKLKAGYQAALDLTPEEIAVATDARNAFDDLAQRGQAHDVLKSFRDNYVTQIWNLNKGPATGSSRTLRDRFRFSKARTFESYFDGEQAGYEAKTKDISKLLPIYLHEMNSVIAARQLVSEMSKGVAEDGRPLLSAHGQGTPVSSQEFAVVKTPGGRAVRLYETQAEAQAALKPGQSIEPRENKATLVMPKRPEKGTEDYLPLGNQPALHNWKYIGPDSEGNPVLLKADLALHPDAFNRLKEVLGRSGIREWYDTRTSAVAQIPKLLVKVLDIANSETKRTMLGLFAPFHQVQEGTHAIGHRIDPFFNIPKIDLVKDAGQMDAARHGAMLLPDRVSGEQFMEGFRVSGLVSRIPGIGPMADFYSHYLFHEYIPGLKYKTYKKILERNQKVYASELSSGTVKLGDVKVLSGEQVNAAYGHLNYADLARNPSLQHFLQLFLLAPDFLEARFRFAGQALTGATGLKVGREQIIALGALAVAQATLAWIGAKTTGGEWDKKNPFEFSVGTRKYTVRSVPEDTMHLLTDSMEFIHNRLSPLIGKGVLQYLSRVDWRSQKVTALETTKELAKQPIPLMLRGPLGTGNSSLKAWEQMAGAVGLKISRYNPRQELNDLHRKFLEKNPDSKVREDFERNQKATYPVSAYADLDNALKDRNDSKALEAIKKLRESGKNDKDIRNRMRPHSLKTGLPKPLFHESRAMESKFLGTLDTKGKALYEKAKQARRANYTRFLKLWDQSNQK